MLTGQPQPQDRLMRRETYRHSVYTLRYTIRKYTWEQAEITCSHRGARVATSPLPGVILESFDSMRLSLQLNIWITNDGGQCLTLKKECKEGSLIRSSWATRCGSFELKPLLADCQTRKEYLICVTGKCQVKFSSN